MKCAHENLLENGSYWALGKLITSLPRPGTTLIVDVIHVIYRTHVQTAVCNLVLQSHPKPASQFLKLLGACEELVFFDKF